MEVGEAIAAARAAYAAFAENMPYGLGPSWKLFMMEFVPRLPGATPELLVEVLEVHFETGQVESGHPEKEGAKGAVEVHPSLPTGRDRKMTATAAALFRANPGRLISKEELCQKCGIHNKPVLDQLIQRLRRNYGISLVCVRGKGWIMSGQKEENPQPADGNGQKPVPASHTSLSGFGASGPGAIFHPKDGEVPVGADRPTTRLNQKELQDLVRRLVEANPGKPISSKEAEVYLLNGHNVRASPTEVVGAMTVIAERDGDHWRFNEKGLTYTPREEARV